MANVREIVACLVIIVIAAAGLGGCGAATNQNPFDALDTVVRTDTNAVNLGTVAIQDGVPASPYGSDLYTGETIFLSTVPILESAAEASAASTLAAGAITQVVLDADISTLRSAVVSLHNAIVNSDATGIQVQHAAIARLRSQPKP